MTKAFLNGAAALLLFLSGCAPASLPPAQSQHAASDLIQEQSVPYQFGVGYSGSGYTQSFEEWRDLVLEDTHGNVELVLYGENVLGEGENMVKAAQRGTLSIAASSTSVCTSIIPEAAILDIPACFTAYTSHFEYMTGNSLMPSTMLTESKAWSCSICVQVSPGSSPAQHPLPR